MTASHDLESASATASILKAVERSTDLRQLDEILTKEMARQRIQALIKGSNLDRVSQKIYSLGGSGDAVERLTAAAVLGRLAAVARTREAQVFERLPELLAAEPPSIETLATGDEKSYAAQSLKYAKGAWVADYCSREGLAIETADLARKELLLTALDSHGSVAATLVALTRNAPLLRTIENLDARYKRIRRVWTQLSAALGDWHGAVGKEPGIVLADCLAAFLRGNTDSASLQSTFDVIEGSFGVLARMIEMRFSNALRAQMYAVVERAKKSIGSSAWSEFIAQSKMLARLRIDLLETALVLARQNRTDVQIMAVLAAAYGSRPQVGVAIKRHFSEALDLDPDVREWWSSGGETTDSRRNVEHRVGNTEDQQIGALLVEVEINRDAMEKLARAVVPYLDISDPVMASTVKRAASGYGEMAQIARRLARMRKLTTTSLRGERLEYNPLEHEMLGGHKAGVRRVEVVREGIQKEFGGKVKTLVKPWVKPEE